MKYKLININTKEEHLCDKITIDGFDYYVSDKCNDLGGWHIDKEFKILSNVSRFNVVTEMKEVIACNNPNIDIPKVVDEVEELVQSAYVKHSVKDDELSLEEQIQRSGGFIVGYKEGYNKSQETHPFSEEDIIEFANFHFRQEFNATPITTKTTEELLQLWKEQKPKTIWYE